MQLQSMTGYGEAEGGGFRVEVRSVNHRYMDIHFKMPSFLSPYEMHLRGILKEYFSRGRFDINITFTEELNVKLQVNSRMVDAVLQTLRRIAEEHSLQEPPGISHLFWFRDSIFQQSPDFSIQSLEETYREALRRLMQMRCVEARALREDILKIINTIERLLDEVQTMNSKDLHQRLNNLRERVKLLVQDINIDESRLMQEVVLLVDRSDISEEIVRLRSHLAQLRDTLQNGPSVGRKLDFLLQECFREVNTIGSKASDIAITERVVRMKTEIEKIREQVQNLQ